MSANVAAGGGGLPGTSGAVLGVGAALPATGAVALWQVVAATTLLAAGSAIVRLMPRSTA